MIPAERSMDSGAETSEAGLSLIELVVYMLLATILLVTMAMILANSWNAQNDVQTTNSATNRGQLIGQNIERAMRNAIAFDVSPDGSMLRVHTTLGGVRECQAFWMTGGAAYMTNSSAALPGAVTIAWPRPWQPTGVIQNGTTKFFAQTNVTVTYTFDMLTDASPVRFQGKAAMRTTTTGASSPCY